PYALVSRSARKLAARSHAWQSGLERSWSCLITPRPPQSTLFPYTTLFRSSTRTKSQVLGISGISPRAAFAAISVTKRVFPVPGGDRKSTRLNSSHVKISYAVFCLKKKRVVQNQSAVHGDRYKLLPWPGYAT